MGESDEFDRGHVAGEIAARLRGHDQHFAAINGSLDRVADEIHGVKMELQRLGDQAKSRDATTITTASALEKAETNRRLASEQRWTPMARFLTVVGSMIAIGTFIWLLVGR